MEEGDWVAFVHSKGHKEARGQRGKGDESTSPVSSAPLALCPSVPTDDADG
jgi:hypothetical protein